MGPEPAWICLMDVVHFVNIYQYNNVCMVILAKVELIQGLLAIDLHVTFEPVPWYISWFATRLQFIMYVNYEHEQWYYDFFQFLDMLLPPGGQIQKSTWLKCCIQIDFIICHKFAIHCACKLWTGMIFRYFPIFRHTDAPWWPNTHINFTEMHFMICYKIVCSLGLNYTEISRTEMLYPDRCHDLPQVYNSLCV